MKMNIFSRILLILPTIILLTGCNEYDRIDQEIDKATSAAIEESDPSLCLNLIEKIQEPDKCDEDIAGTYCRPSTKHPQNECLRKYTEETGSLAACELMPNPGKDFCFAQVAEMNSDPSICDKIAGEHTWQLPVNCRAIATLDINKCYEVDYLEDYYRKYASTRCISEVVYRTKNIEDCGRIEEIGHPDWQQHTSTCLWISDSPIKS